MCSAELSVDLVYVCACVSTDCGGFRAQGKRSGRSAACASPQHGRKPERPLPAALLHYTKGSSFQGEFPFLLLLCHFSSQSPLWIFLVQC